jgi:hypothetical protein
MRIATLLLTAVLIPAGAQDFKLPPALDRLAARAQATVDVSLDKSLLRLAAHFLSDRDDDQVRAKRLIAGLDSVNVRSYEFDATGEYTRADVDAVRAQLQPPAWSRVIGVTSKRNSEDADVYIKTESNGNVGGVVIIAADAKELTIVHIAGSIDPAQLADLGGRWHIPRIVVGSTSGKRRPR